MECYLGYERMDMLKLLPAEISQWILMHLDLKDLLSASLTSKPWHRLSNSEVIWRRICNKFNVTPENIGYIPEIDEINTLYKMCPSKSIFYRYMQIVHHWKHNSTTNISVKLPTSDDVVCIAFHGSTLAVGVDNNTVIVYKTVKRKRFALCQILSELTNHDGLDISSIVMDSRFIIVKYGAVIIVYIDAGKSYEVSYFLFDVLHNESLLCCYDIHDFNKHGELTTVFRVCSKEECMILSGNILYLHMAHKGKLFIWDLNNKRIIREINTNTYFTNMVKFNDMVYVGERHAITCYNTTGGIKNRIEEKEGEIKHVYCNKNVVLATGCFKPSHKGIKVWDRHSGAVMMVRCTILSCDFLLHPLLNIVIYMTPFLGNTPSTKFLLQAVDLQTKETVWSAPMKTPTFIHQTTLDIVANRFIMLQSPSFSNLPEKMSIYDCDEGQLQYTLLSSSHITFASSYVTVSFFRNRQKLKVRFY